MSYNANKLFLKHIDIEIVLTSWELQRCINQSFTKLKDNKAFDYEKARNEGDSISASHYPCKQSSISQDRDMLTTKYFFTLKVVRIYFMR